MLCKSRIRDSDHYCFVQKLLSADGLEFASVKEILLLLPRSLRRPPINPTPAFSQTTHFKNERNLKNVRRSKETFILIG